MEDPKTSVVARIKEANNVLVTVSSNPSVDQLAAAIGFTLLLNKLGKHAAAVFSGNIPSTIEFLQPEQTLEKTTDSLRDFIIALDKSKADKLRYKVEDKMVKIFITPFRTSISQEDLDFSQGDFNIDVVLAVGVHEQQDLDSAITAHGRILHDATIISINNHTAGSLGTINWVDERASSLCEMLASIGPELKEDIFDSQMATALLTGIVAETHRFSNEKTTPATMSISAKLMSAGANQQLVATQLQESGSSVSGSAKQGAGAEGRKINDDTSPDGSLRIDHNSPNTDDNSSGLDTDQPQYDSGHFSDEDRNKTGSQDTPMMILDPPTLGGKLTANTEPEGLDPSTDPMTLPPVSPPLLDHTPLDGGQPDTDVSSALRSASTSSDNNDDNVAGEPTASPPVNQTQPTLETPSAIPPTPTPSTDEPEEPEIEDNQTLASLEEAVDSPHLAQASPGANGVGDVSAARDAVSQAVASGTSPVLEPITALNAQPIDLNSPAPEVKPLTQASPAPPTAQQSGDEYLDVTKLDEKTGLPANLVPPNDNLPADNTAASVVNPTAPPPVPPPMMPMAPPEERHQQFGQQPLPNAENDNDAQDPIAPL